MTPAIPDGYEIVTEWRDGLKLWNTHEWVPSGLNPHIAMPRRIIYIAPIRLRLGENYRCRNGQEIVDLARNVGFFKETHKFWSALAEQSFADDGHVMMNPAVKSDWDIVAHIPKEKKMEPKIRYQSPRNVSQYTKEERQIDDLRDVVESMPADQRLTEAGNKIEEALLLVLEYNDEQIEKERQKRENEIKVGDWFRHKSGSVDRCEVVMRDTFCGLLDFKFDKENCTKIPGPPEFIAFLESGVKK